VVYRKGRLTLEIVTRCELVIRTLRFGSWNNTDAKFGCSIKTIQFTMKSQLESDVSEISVRKSKL